MFLKFIYLIIFIFYYLPNLALSDFYLFCSMKHFLRKKNSNKNLISLFFSSKKALFNNKIFLFFLYKIINDKGYACINMNASKYIFL